MADVQYLAGQFSPFRRSGGLRTVGCMTPMHGTTPTEHRPDNVVDLNAWRKPKCSLRVIIGDIVPDLDDDWDDDPPPIAS